MNDQVKGIYEMIYEQVEKLGEIRDTDKVVIQQLAFNIYTVQKCQEQLLEQGFTQTGLHGVKEHPCINIKTKAEQQIKNQLIVLGLDFASQMKKKLVEPDDGSQDELILKVLRGEAI